MNKGNRLVAAAVTAVVIVLGGVQGAGAVVPEKLLESALGHYAICVAAVYSGLDDEPDQKLRYATAAVACSKYRNSLQVVLRRHYGAELGRQALGEADRAIFSELSS